MELFQPSVLQHTPQNESLVAHRWAAFQNYLAKIDFIRSVKEEKYQDGFLKDVFENCLGYTLDSTDPTAHTLEREKKNETDGKKADGVILIDGIVSGVIELKDQTTKNLDTVEAQAFNYHNSHSNSKYIIISNFDELRFYIDKKTAYKAFRLFTLTYNEFKILHLLLSYESIRDHIPIQLKEKSAKHEQEISKELYRDFSAFRSHLFENIVKNNLGSEASASPSDGTKVPFPLDKQTLLRLTQKLCDRIIFILFAEDRTLLRHHTIREIREEFKNQKFTTYALYDIYKFYFRAINEGNEKLSIPKYNGGLFATDTVLDSLIIEDAYLDMEAQKLSDYDFASDISVNILGHIFEQSLTDLEEMEKSFDSDATPQTAPAISKRKKDGVFYTPEYITRYIVENTLGKLCAEKKEEIFGSGTLVPPINPKKLTKEEKQTLANLYAYRDYLLGLKILDPACGSGAFLNQALEFLIREHRTLDEYRRIYENEALSLYDIETNILEHNLYGVDINEDAVEIARLSLWLRTAQKGRALTNLSDKIVCANSLLAMPFPPESFDVVIGNPPYVRQEMIKEQKPALQEKYTTFSGTADLYVYFYELAYKMLKDNASMGYICSNKFFASKYGENLRELILQKMSIEKISNFGDKKVFEDAVVTSDITIFKKNIPSIEHRFEIVDVELNNSYEMPQSAINKIGFVFLPANDLMLKSKIEHKGTNLKLWDISIKSGIKTGFNEAFIIDEDKKNELIKLDPKNSEIIKPYLRGRDIERYSYNYKNLWLLNIHNDPPINIDLFPSLKEHLNKFYKNIENRSDKGISPYHLRNCAFLDDYEKEKIIWIELSDLGKFTLDTEKHYVDMTIFFITGESLKYLLALLNSKLIFWYFNLICAESGVGTNR